MFQCVYPPSVNITVYIIFGVAGKNYEKEGEANNKSRYIHVKLYEYEIDISDLN